MTDFERVYRSQAQEYERLVQHEDRHHNLPKMLDKLVSWDGKNVLELGAGTGRLTRMLCDRAGRVTAIDRARGMLSVADRTRRAEGWGNCALILADNRHLPLKSASHDIAVAGWSIGHSIEWHPVDWRKRVAEVLQEVERCLRPRGAALILETLGTGREQPEPPTAGLADYYQMLEEQHGFERTWIRTDYEFSNAEQGAQVVRFFFGDDLADRIQREQLTVIPECTGVWHRIY